MVPRKKNELLKKIIYVNIKLIQVLDENFKSHEYYESKSFRDHKRFYGTEKKIS
jgi:hypothetical protein